MPTLRSQIAAAPVPTLSVWANNFGSASSVQAISTRHVMFFPLTPSVFPGVATLNTLAVGFSGSALTSFSASHTFSASIGLYRLSGSDSLALINSASSSWGTAAGAAGLSSMYQGPRQLTFHSSQWSSLPALSQGQYWVALRLSSSNAHGSLSYSGARWMQSLFSGYLGVGNTNSSSGRPYPGMGVWTNSTSAALPATVAFADLRQVSALAGVIPTIVIHNIGV